MNICWLLIPLEKSRFFHWKSIPSLSSIRNFLVCFSENFRSNAFVLNLLDFIFFRPNLTQKHILSVLVFRNWIFFKINVNSSCNGEGDYERRRCQKVCFGLRMDSSFKISISTENWGYANVFTFDCLLNLLMDFSWVSNTSHASVTGMIESHCIHILCQSRNLKILRNSLRSWWKWGFDIRWNLDSSFMSIFAK